MTGNAYVVIEANAEHITAVRSIDVRNPSEWELVGKSVRADMKRAEDP